MRFIGLYISGISLLFCLSNLEAQERTVGLLQLDASVIEGYTLFSPIAYNESYLIDNCGRLINKWTSEYNAGLVAYLLEDGSLLRAGKDEQPLFGAGGSGGVVEKISWDNEVLWSYTFSSNRILSHHDIEPLPNGNFLILLWEQTNLIEIEESGRHSSYIDSTVGLWFEKIVEIEPIGENQINQVWEWHVKDHLIQDLDSTLNNFGIVSDHPEKIDINYPYRPQFTADWLHFNSIDYNEALDQILVSSRNNAEVYVIDHSTTTEEARTDQGGEYGKGGGILYRWGNPIVYKRGNEEDQKLFGQHDAQWSEINNENNDRILIFNNGVGELPITSSIDLVQNLSADGHYEELGPNETFAPTRSSKIITSNAFLDFTSPRMSGVQELPDNHLLICSSNKYEIFELDENKNVVWHYENPISNFGPVPQFTSIGGRDIFNAHKYAIEFPGFVGKDLTPQLPLVQDSLSSICDSILTFSFDVSTKNDIEIYPNPSIETIRINSSLIDNFNFTIVNTQGLIIKNGILQSQQRLDISDLNSGVYILHLANNHYKFEQSFKLIKI